LFNDYAPDDEPPSDLDFWSSQLGFGLLDTVFNDGFLFEVALQTFVESRWRHESIKKVPLTNRIGFILVYSKLLKHKPGKRCYPHWFIVEIKKEYPSTSRIEL